MRDGAVAEWVDGELSPHLKQRGLSLGPAIEHRRLTACYSATRHTSGRPLVLKILHDTAPALVENFSREVRLLDELTGCDGVPRLVDAGEWQGRPYHLTTRASGRALAGPESGLRRVRFGTALRVCAGLARVLARLHGLGVVHRDVSPEHIFWSRDARVTLVDFGMARRLDGLPPDRARRYFAYDVQAVGLVLWELLVQRPVFSYRRPGVGEQIGRARLLVQSAELPPPLKDTLARSLAVESEFSPEDTIGGPPFGAAGELVKALERVERWWRGVA